MDITSAFATNTDAELNGTIVEYGDAKFTIARKGSAAYRKLLSKLYKQHRVLLEGKSDAAEAKSDQILAEVISKTILLGWENVSSKGKPLPYSQEAAYDLLLNLKEFRNFVDEASGDLERFKLIQDETDEKN